MSRFRIISASLVLALVASGCGETVLVKNLTPNATVAQGPQAAQQRGPTLRKPTQSVNLGVQAPRLRGGSAAQSKCATNSNPSQGFTSTSMKWGTIIPLSGALRPLGEQTARVMKVSVNILNSITSLPGTFDWGCPKRPGIYGRTVQLKVLSLNQNTQDETAAAMRRLIDVDKVFLVRDCYLELNITGPATQYQNAKKVPAVWCYFNDMPYPKLARYNFAPGTDPLKNLAIQLAFMVRKLHRKRLAILSDPAFRRNHVVVEKQVYKYLLGRDVPDRCIVYTKGQDAQGGMQAQIQQIRTCYSGVDPAHPEPDMVIANDAFNGIFGAISATNGGWDAQANNVQWSCNTCWVQTLADLCREACEGMITDCQALPCIPWSKLPAAATLRDVKRQYLASEPEDILTYGPLAITLGLGVFLGTVGPDLSREKLAHTLGNLRNFDFGIGPILNTNSQDHFGGKAVWLIKFTNGGFEDYTNGFVTLSQMGVPERLTTR
jgi:substrate-binding family protein